MIITSKAVYVWRIKTLSYEYWLQVQLSWLFTDTSVFRGWSLTRCDFGLFQAKNKISLRNLSMVLRQVGGSPSDRAKLVEESVEKAKEAVQLDIQDGTSWCKRSYGSWIIINSSWFNISQIHYPYDEWL